MNTTRTTNNYLTNTLELMSNHNLPTRNTLSVLNGYYVIKHINARHVQDNTIHFQRKGSINLFLKESNMTWQECQKQGWRVYKVNIEFQQLL